MCTPVIESETENSIPPSSFDRCICFFGPKISRDPEAKFWPGHIFHVPVFNEYRIYKKQQTWKTILHLQIV